MYSEQSKNELTHIADDFQRKLLELLIAVGVVVYGAHWLVSFLQHGTAETLYYVYSLGLIGTLFVILRRGHTQLATRLVVLITFSTLLDPSASYASAATVALTLVQSAAFVLIIRRMPELILAIALNMVVYGVIAWQTSDYAAVHPLDAYTDVVTGLITTVMINLVIVSIGLFIRFDQRARNQRLLDEELLRAELLKTFLENASHDLKTPLTHLRMDLFLLEKKLHQNPSKYLRSMERALDRLEMILNSMLEITELEHMTEIRSVPIKLNLFMDTVIGQFRDRAVQKGLYFIYTPAQDVLLVKAHQMLLSRGISNILDNAIRYTPNGGQITVQCHKHKHNIYIEIRDTGPGIPAGVLPHIFERFYREDTARNTETGGAGLGLSIAKHIITLHGGRIEVDSVVGEGSLFRIVLPDSHMR